MIDSEGGAFGFDCYLASPEFRVFQQPARGRRLVATASDDLPALQPTKLEFVINLKTEGAEPDCVTHAARDR